MNCLMNTRRLVIGPLLILLLTLAGCSKAHGDTGAGDPPPPNVVSAGDATLFTVDHPEKFPLASATARPSVSELVVTGTVAPDVSRSVPVVSLASGRVVAIHARLGDTVRKGQLLFTVRSDDVAAGFSNYRKALADETLTRTQVERAQDLYTHGAIALNDLQIAQDTDRPNAMVDVFAPSSGVITDQQIANGSGIQAFGTPNPFTISDLSNVWLVCDVYENDLPNVRPGDIAEIRLNAYPDRVFKGRVGIIGAVLDPAIRTAKVRIEVQNPGIMRVGMFVRATFRGQTREMHTTAPASAILHMHDSDFVFVPAPDKKFRRVEVVSGDLLQDNMTLQEIRSGLEPGQQLVTNALVLDHVLKQ